MAAEVAMHREESLPRSIFIPVQGSDEGVEVFVDELPADVNDLIDVLKAEMAPLEIWLQFAVEFYKQGRQDAFLQILREGSDPVVEEYYNDSASRMARIKILNTLAAHCTKSMLKERRKDDLKQAALDYFNRADRIDHMYEMTWVGKGVMYLSVGDVTAAQYQLDNALQQHRENIPAHLGKACIAFMKGRYLEARRYYKEAIMLNPLAPNASNLRLMFGICCYKLGQPDKAKDAVKRALELDPKNVDAIVALAVLQLRSTEGTKEQRKQRLENALHMLSQAYNVDNTHPMILNHLADHYFWKWIRVPGTVSVRQGSPIITCSRELIGEFSVGSPVRIGEQYGSNVEAVLNDHQLRLTEKYNLASETDLPLFKKDFQRTLQLATNAYHNTEVPEIRAESCYLMARTFHAERKFKEAYEQYFNATRNNQSRDFVLAHFGLGQYYIYEAMENPARRSANLEKAIECFEKVLVANSESREALLILGWLHSQTKRKDQAIQYFRRVIELKPTDVQAQLEIAQLLQQRPQDGGQEQALAAYLRVEQLLGQRSEKIEFQLLNNIAVLHHVLGNLSPAQTYYIRALEAIEKSEKEEHMEEQEEQSEEEPFNWEKFILEEDQPRSPMVTATNVTTLYNLARLLEKKGSFNVAETLYKAIIEFSPSYVDCILRLGCIAKERGRVDEAKARFEAALQQNPKNSEDILALIGSLHLSKKEWAIAQKQFEKILEKRKHDSYACIALGNIFLANLDERGKYEKYIELCKDYYRKVLSLEPLNIYAANGLGVVLAERGHLEEAKEVFTQVREAAPDVPDVWINLAHLSVSAEKYEEAVQLYQTCNKKCFNGQNVELHLYLSHAYYLSKRFDKCIETLTAALVLAPSDDRLWYNLALAAEESAVAALQRTSGRTLADVERAVQNLQQALRTFAYLVGKAEEGSVPFDKSKCEKHVLFCRDNLDKAQVHLQHERREEEKKKALLAEQQQRRKERKEREELERRKKEEEEEEKRKALIEAARKREEQLSRLTAQWGATQKESEEKTSKRKSSKGKGKKKKEELESDESDKGDDGDLDLGDLGEDLLDKNPRLKNLLKKKGKKTKKQRERALSSESSDGGADYDEKELFGTDVSDNEEEGKDNTASANGKAGDENVKRYISDVKEIFGSDSEEDDDDDFGQKQKTGQAEDDGDGGKRKADATVDDEDGTQAPAAKRSKVIDDEDEEE